MTTVAVILEELIKLEKDRSQSDREHSLLAERRQALARDLRAALLAGDTTGDELLDAIIVNHASSNPEYIERLRTIEREFAAHPDGYVLIIEREAQRFIYRDPGPARAEDFTAVERLTLGRLNGTKLVVDRSPPKADGDAPLIRPTVGPEHWRLGFPTSGYIVDPRIDPKPLVVPGNFFPGNDLLLTYLQPLRTYADDDWSTGFPALECFPFVRRGGPGGHMLEIFVGEEKIMAQMARRFITSPLFMWWIRRAFGDEVPATPEIEVALGNLADEYRQTLAKHLADLAERQRLAKIPELEATINATLERMNDLAIDLGPDLRSELAKARLPHTQ